MKLNEKGSVTLIVLVTILFIVILLSSFLIYTNLKRREQLKETKEISNIYDGDMEAIYGELKGRFNTSYGRIEVVWLDKENNIIEKPLAPVLGGMTPVKWNGTTESTTTATDANWYEYKAIEGTEDNLTSRWANAKNSDGSYFVWIPRYGYRITYYQNEESNDITGYCDGRGIVDALGNVEYKLDEGIETVKDVENNKSYIVHPAFMKDDEHSYEHGGWSSDLAGIWVGKYEASHSDATASSMGSNNIIKIVPNVQSWRNITVGDTYTNAYNYDRTKESHLVKNSEWGAIVYLTHSQYGRNGHEIDINNSSNCITGNGGGSINATEKVGITNSYTTQIGQKASSTGNIYGIYDLSGGAWEFVALFNDTDTKNYYTYGSSFASKAGNSTKYSTKYNNSEIINNGIRIYEIGKIGEASKEVYNYQKVNNWNNDYSIVVGAERPFLLRGGAFENSNFSGVFSSGCSYGGNYTNYSFRIILII